MWHRSDWKYLIIGLTLVALIGLGWLGLVIVCYHP